MQYLDTSTYAFREFYARNTHLAPNPKSRRKRLAVCAALLVIGSGAATGAYLVSMQLQHGGLVAPSLSHAAWMGKVKSMVTSIATSYHIGPTT